MKGRPSQDPELLRLPADRRVEFLLEKVEKLEAEKKELDVACKAAIKLKVMLDERCKELYDENQKLKQGDTIMLKTLPAHNPTEYGKKYDGRYSPIEWWIRPDGTLDAHRTETIRRAQFKINREGAVERIEKEEESIAKMIRRHAPADMVREDKEELERMKEQLASNDKETEMYEKQVKSQAVYRALFVAEKLGDDAAVGVLEAEKKRTKAIFPAALIRAVMNRYELVLEHVRGDELPPLQVASKEHAKMLEREDVRSLEIHRDALIRDVRALQENVQALEEENKGLIQVQKERERQADNLIKNNEALRQDLTELAEDVEKFASENERLKRMNEELKGTGDPRPETPITHRLNVRNVNHKEIGGTRDKISGYVDLVDSFTGQSDPAKLVEKGEDGKLLNGVERHILVTMFAEDGTPLLKWGEEAVGVTFRWKDYDPRSKFFFHFELPVEMRKVGKYELRAMVMDATEEYRRGRSQCFAPAEWCDNPEEVHYLNTINGAWLLHKDPDYFVELGGSLPIVTPMGVPVTDYEEEAEDSCDSKLLSAVWDCARRFEAQGKAVWKRWQGVWDLLTGNHSEMTLLEIQMWHDLALIRKKEGKNWKAALELLPMVIDFLEQKGTMK